MKLSEFRHKLNAVVGAYVSTRNTTEDHDEVITVRVDNFYDSKEVADVVLGHDEEGNPTLWLLSPEAVKEREALFEVPDPEKEGTE